MKLSAPACRPPWPDHCVQGTEGAAFHPEAPERHQRADDRAQGRPHRHRFLLGVPRERPHDPYRPRRLPEGTRLHPPALPDRAWRSTTASPGPQSTRRTGRGFDIAVVWSRRTAAIDLRRSNRKRSWTHCAAREINPQRHQPHARRSPDTLPRKPPRVTAATTALTLTKDEPTKFLSAARRFLRLRRPGAVAGRAGGADRRPSPPCGRRRCRTWRPAPWPPPRRGAATGRCCRPSVPLLSVWPTMKTFSPGGRLQQARHLDQLLDGPRA